MERYLGHSFIREPTISFEQRARALKGQAPRRKTRGAAELAWNGCCFMVTGFMVMLLPLLLPYGACSWSAGLLLIGSGAGMVSFGMELLARAAHSRQKGRADKC